MRILALSDIEDERLPVGLDQEAGTIDLVIGCGDLAYAYLDHVATAVGAPLRAVHGNHDVPMENIDDPAVREWWQGIDLHGRVSSVNGALVGGVEGSPRYKPGPYQANELDVWLTILRMVPALLLNRIRHGRFLDVLVTHAPPRGVQDLPDRTHRGFLALRAFIRLFAPRVHVHGHTHVYDSRTETTTRFGRTTVINAYRARTFEL